MALCIHNVPTRCLCPDCLAIRRTKNGMPVELHLEGVEDGSTVARRVPHARLQSVRRHDGRGVRGY